MSDTGQDRHHLDRRKVRKARGNQQQNNPFVGDACAHLVEGVELAVEFQDRLGDGLEGVVAERPAGDAAEHGGDGRCQRIAPGPFGLCQRHGQEQDIRGDKKDGAFDEGDNGQPDFRRFAAGQRHGPIVEST